MFKNKGVILIIFTMLLQLLVIEIINQFIFMADALKYVKNFLPYVSGLLFILIFLVLLSINKLSETIKRNTESRLLKSQLKQVENLNNILQTQKHEYSRHIQTIQSMLYLEEIDSAKNYLNELTENHKPIADIKYTYNTALTILLNSKIKVAEDKNINFDFAIKCDLERLKINDRELCSIIGNLIDNAFEATVESENNVNRYVGLEIKFENNNFIIYVSNTGNKIPREIEKKLFNPGFTTKGTNDRGYGLYLIKKIVKQYGGTIEVSSNKKTTFKVKISLKDEMD
ncbi:MAG: GHKL domain-containing protein [Firmicutes bacterium]|nr:GHKL domain-containing protein [Bacillota bacterium]